MISPVQRTSLSTAILPQQHRVAIWREVYGRLLMGVDIEPIGVDPFEAETKLIKLPGVAISAGWRTAAHFSVTRPLLATATDNIVLAMVLRGTAHATQLGRSVKVQPGQAVLMTSCDLGRNTLTGRGRHISVLLPRSHLTPFLKNVERQLLRPIDGSVSALKLLRSYVSGSLSLDENSPVQLADLPARHLRDLIAAICGVPEGEFSTAPSGLRAARLQAAKREIRARLADHELSTHEIAELQNISPDYIRKLFREENLSFRTYVLEQRLEAAHAYLADPLRASQTISDIALATGFYDVSYFSRRFRRRYGLSPSEYRQSSQLDRGKLSSSS